MKFLVLSVLLALSGAAYAETHDHGHPGVTRAVIDPGGSVTIHALDDVQVSCRAGHGPGPGPRVRIGVELFNAANCGANPSWTVAQQSGCSLSSRPDFYCNSYRSVYSDGSRGTCTSTPRVEEDACCNAAFNGI